MTNKQADGEDLHLSGQGDSWTTDSNSVSSTTSPPPFKPPKPHGILHESLQLIESPVKDVPSLRSYLGEEEDPMCNWKSSKNVDESDPTTWFPRDDKIAFYSPQHGNHKEYDALSYHELQAHLRECPPFQRGSRVAIVIPAEKMDQYAMAVLSVVCGNAVAVPLDPRMPRLRILDAMEHLQCTCLVSTEDWLLDNKVVAKELEKYNTHPSLLDDEDTNIKHHFNKNVTEIRIITSSGKCGLIDWECFSSKNNDWVPHSPQSSSEPTGSSGSDLALLLRTSGTTSTPKIVPITLSTILYMSLSLATALGLKRNDCCANALPFYHIGGIACNLLAVLLSGSSVLMTGPLQDPNVFLDHLLTSHDDHSSKPAVTWYYAGPPMHKAIVLMAEARHQNAALPSHLRFIRNAQSHINHELVLQLSTIFGAPVIPTYAMTEAMPISFSTPIDASHDPPCAVIDSVGHPLCSLRVVEPDSDSVLEYDTESTDDDGDKLVGEICVKGPGVIASYLGVHSSKTHSSDGWLRTGDKGYLDKQGRLFIMGRIKEMIKRGGEQVWPNEVDDVVDKVPGVAVAITFGVENDLWGEEVAVAVVLQDPQQIDNSFYLDRLEKDIIQACKEKLDDISVPRQIKFLASKDDVVGGTDLWTKGKKIRSSLAEHLGVKAVDTGALRSLTMASQIQAQALAKNTDNENHDDQTLWQKFLALLETTHEEGDRVIPCDALNGVRFLVTLFVVQVHVGLFPNMTWVKLQGYPPNMMIFFSIAGFQTTCQVARSVKGQWAHFVGTKIGALHSLFMISQVITFPSYVLFRAFDEDGQLVWTTGDWVWNIVWFFIATITGMGCAWSVNMFTWFQSAYYIFLAIFPFLDDRLRRQTLKRQLIVFVITVLAAGAIWALIYISVPQEIFWEYIYPFGWTILPWFPLLCASMIAAYFFRRLIEYYWQQKIKELDDTEMQQYSHNPGTIEAVQVSSHTALWGWICDGTSLFLLIAAILVAVLPNCICMYSETFEAMRPGEEIEEYGCPPFRRGLDDYVWTCDINYDEWIGYIQPDPNHLELGRFVTNFSGGFGYLHCSAPVFLLWCCTMGFGSGYTSKIFSSRLFQALAPLGYPVYLVHMAVVRYYWVATRGLEKQHWWGEEGEFPVPIEWWEFFLVLLMSIGLGALINAFLVPPCLPYTISWGVKVCTWLSVCVGRCTRCLFGADYFDGDTESDGSNSESGKEDTQTMKQLKTMIRGLTGMEEVTTDLPLQHLGLDSLGATALLGTLRSTVPAARGLTLKDLQACDNVGSLHDFLEGGGQKH